MRPLLTYLVPVYWMAAFALLASHAASQPHDLDLFMVGGPGSIVVDVGVDLSRGASTAFSIGFGLVATLFLWTFLTAILGAGDYPGGYEEVASIAFGGAIVVVTVALVVSAARSGASVQGASAFQLAALAASYAAVIAERRVFARARPSEAEDLRAAARRMALGAAHSSLLNRLARRAGTQGGAD
jgi:hypothetical protein